MADAKLDLPDDLILSSKIEASGGNEMDKVPLGFSDDSKDQLANENSIPLSPQWLYSKPSETKLDMRGPNSVALGNSVDPSQKDGWRLDGSEDKKDWRRLAPESEGNHRWREEERETSLLGARRDRRKTDRRTENVAIRETIDNKVLPSSDRWHDGSNRNSGHEARRDSKWSSRWGPEDKEKESRIEKRADVEKEKDDTQNENLPSIGSNRPTSERDSDSRDKWRPRHRMESHSSGSSFYRAAPGFGLERGRTEGSNLGFTVGRGRLNAIGRGIVGTSHVNKNGNAVGKPSLSIDSYCYPRGKLLDIYRSQKLDPSYGMMPEEMDETLPITQVSFIEPLAFVAPDTEEEAILTDIWKGKITSSGVVYNAFRKGRSTENISGVGESESTEGKQGIVEGTDAFQEPANEEVSQIDGICSSKDHVSNADALNEKEGDHKEECKIIDRSNEEVIRTDNVYCAKEDGTPRVVDGKTWQLLEPAFRECAEHDPSVDVKSKLPDDSSMLFGLASSEQTKINTHSHLLMDKGSKDLERVAALEDLYFFYIDPNGNTQGPFLGADIILWFEEGYFGTELPVCPADAPEGTPFRSLGDVMPQLKLRGETFSNELEKSVPSVEKTESSIPILDTTHSSASNGLSQSSDLNSFVSQQHAFSRTSEPEVPLQLPRSDGENFHVFAGQDEEIVFPGRPSNAGYLNPRSSGNIHDLLASTTTQPPVPTELIEPALPYQKDNKLHPFGLFWSELEGSHTRSSETLDVPVNVEGSASYDVVNDTGSAADKWADILRPDALSVPNSIPDAIAARHLPHNEQDLNHFALAEQLIARQYQQQQQLHQRNILSSHSHVPSQNLIHHQQPAKHTVEDLEHLLALRLQQQHSHVPSQNLIHHQQPANHTVEDLEHLLALRLQQQHSHVPSQNLIHQQQPANHTVEDLEHLLSLRIQQRQIQAQQRHHQQQHFHQQQKLLQERQQLQARQVLLEQLKNHIPEPGLPHSRVDPIRANNALDQVLLEQQLLQEVQQRSHNPFRHFVPQVEQLAQSKLGLVAQQEQQRDLFELLPRGQHGQVQSLEHKILLEQLQARQLSMTSRQRRNLEEERRIDPVWPVNETGQFLGNLASNHRAHSSGIKPLDFYQRQQMSPHESQLAQLERNLSFQDRLQQGLYEPGSVPFERSLSSPAGASGMNMDVVNAMVRSRGLEMQDLNTRMQSAGQGGTFSSGVPSHSFHHPMVPNQFHASQLDAVEGRWSENNGQLTNDWMESQVQQLHINAERQRRESEVKLAAEDSSSWMSDGSNDDKSRRLLMELLNQRSGHQMVDSLHANGAAPFERRVASGLYSGSGSLDHNFGAFPGQETLNNSFSVGSYGSNVSEPADLHTANEQASFVESNENSAFRSDSRVTTEGHSFVSGVGTAQSVLTDCSITDKLLTNKDYLEVEERRRGSKNMGVTKSSASDIHDSVAEKVRLAYTDRREDVNAISRQGSFDIGGFYDDKVAPQNSLPVDITINRVPVPSKVQESILLRRQPVSHALSPQEGLAELVSDTATRGKSSLNSDDGGNPANQTNDSKRELGLRHNSSGSDADVSEPSFIDMLKSNTRKTTASEVHPGGISESSEGGQGAKSGKKKGKKGRQINPALLGFKVTSNRIMMGEIQRVDD
ncbi:hypothetical protein K2173_006671 [Erythroxylum novogranatense]|uniref:GYF domain-containing protein n=1 Tax=Erythroxylum novogranatense TaxID=1862640 RepID=A0AAV8SYJ2_9ROSI|nr:hypothetical protein K2173_006671 [Erythroxylum novogranatense]